MSGRLFVLLWLAMEACLFSHQIMKLMSDVASPHCTEDFLQVETCKKSIPSNQSTSSRADWTANIESSAYTSKKCCIPATLQLRGAFDVDASRAEVSAWLCLIGARPIWPGN